MTARLLLLLGGLAAVTGHVTSFAPFVPNKMPLRVVDGYGNEILRWQSTGECQGLASFGAFWVELDPRICGTLRSISSQGLKP